MDILKGLKYDDRPLVFWVRNDQAFSHMGKYERAKNLHYTARNCLVYDMKSDEVRFEDCDKHERDIVCEYDQARMYWEKHILFSLWFLDFVKMLCYYGKILFIIILNLDNKDKFYFNELDKLLYILCFVVRIWTQWI